MLLKGPMASANQTLLVAYGPAWQLVCWPFEDQPYEGLYQPMNKWLQAILGGRLSTKTKNQNKTNIQKSCWDSLGTGPIYVCHINETTCLSYNSRLTSFQGPETLNCWCLNSPGGQCQGTSVSLQKLSQAGAPYCFTRLFLTKCIFYWQKYMTISKLKNGWLEVFLPLKIS